MDWFLLLGIITFSILIVCFIAYATTTSSIIKDQEREIAALKTTIKRLKAKRGGNA